MAFATCGNDNMLCLWSETDAKQSPLPLMRVRVGHKSCGLAFSCDGTMLAVGCANGFVKIFGVGNVTAGQRRRSRGRVSPSGRVSPAGSSGRASPNLAGTAQPPTFLKVRVALLFAEMGAF